MAAKIPPPPSTRNASAKQKPRRQPSRLRQLLLFALAGILLSVILGLIEKVTGRPIPCFSPGCPPPCPPPQVGYWPDCHNHDPEPQPKNQR